MKHAKKGVNIQVKYISKNANPFFKFCNALKQKVKIISFHNIDFAQMKAIISNSYNQ